MPSKSPNKLGRYLRQCRIANRLSQMELADLLGATQATISHLETGRITNPSISLVKRYRDILGVDVNIVLSFVL